MKTIEERKKATAKATKSFIERIREKHREFILTLVNGIRISANGLDET